MTDPLGLLRRGLNRPDKIPRYVWGLLVPSDRWGPEWHRRDDLVTFEPGGFAASARTRSEFAANCFYEASGLRAICAEHLEDAPRRSLEVGCGYGRLTPWIATQSDEHVAIEPDRRALERAAVQYANAGQSADGAIPSPPIDVAFVRARAESLPLPDGAVDLAVTWTVLQHVPPESIEAAAAELARALAPGGLAVCCERVEPPADDHIWPRSRERYADLFDPLERVGDYERPVEPTWREAMPTDRPAERVLVFRAPDGPTTGDDPD